MSVKVDKVRLRSVFKALKMMVGNFSMRFLEITMLLVALGIIFGAGYLYLQLLTRYEPLFWMNNGVFVTLLVQKIVGKFRETYEDVYLSEKFEEDPK